MRLRVTSVDYSPKPLDRAVPFDISLLRELPGPDRSDYWLGKTEKPIALTVDGLQLTASHFIVAARWQGTRIEPHAEHLPINLAVVVDLRQVQEASVDFGKSKFIAIGMASEVEGGSEPKPLTDVLAGNVGAFFGRGTRKQ